MEKFKNIIKKGILIGKIGAATIFPMNTIEHVGNPERFDKNRTQKEASFEKDN